MKGFKLWSWLLLVVLLATCLLPVAGLGVNPPTAYDPSISVGGSTSASGSVGKFTSGASFPFRLQGCSPDAPYPSIQVRVRHNGSGNYYDGGSTSTSGDGDYAVTLSVNMLNGLPAGSFTVLASSPAAGANTGFGEQAIGTIRITQTTYSITFEEVEGGTATASPSTAHTGDKIDITARNKAGYYFVNWTVVSGNPQLSGTGHKSLSFTMPSGNVVLRPNFRPNVPGEENDSESSGSSTSSSQWSTGQSDGTLNYTPVMVDARNLPVTGTILTDSAPIYAAPLAGTASAGAFKKDDELTMLGYDNGYFATLVGARTMGYVNGNDTKFTIDPGINATLLQATVTSSDDPDATTDATASAPSLPVGSPVLISGRDGENWLITSGGQNYAMPATGGDGLPTLSLSAEDLTAIAGSYTFPATGTVRDGGVRIRASASSSGSQLGTLAGRATFTAVGYEDGFVVVQRTTGEIGYVQAGYVNITFSPPLYGTMLMNAAAYTQGVSQSRYFLKTVPVNTVVAIHGREGSWWRVTVAGETMYIKEENINVPTIK